MSTVRTHTRRQNGKTVTVTRHQRDPAAAAATAQRKRDTFQRRVMAERQRAAHPEAYTKTPARVPGEAKRRRRGPKPARAKRHARKALRLWRRHKVRALFYGGLAFGEVTAWAAWRAGARARRGWRVLRNRRNRRRRR